MLNFYDVILSVSCVCGYDESLFGSVWIVAEESLWCILQEDKCSAEETLLAADGFVRRINAPRGCMQRINAPRGGFIRPHTPF
jgi:hypothetical protein